MKVAERIRLSVEESIRDGSLLPGDSVDEQLLMQTYDVSRTPVREALLQLQAQGLVASLPRGGMVVAKMDVAQLMAMWELLAELEGIGARLACERMTPAEREELGVIHERAAAVVRREDTDAWQEHNRRFHEALYAGARNPYLRQEILRMRSRTGAYRLHAFSAFGRLASSWEQHAQLLAAIQDQEPGRAAELMARHMSPGQGSVNFASFVAALPKNLLA
ncbi:GntR family transcriptional regulator [Bordetella trematum]|uniref:GntR family transcriptional regulator n=1 Tax=Bordetella trematum TaxID=123899 RepID=A0A157RPP9_9BORD|nr:GntR family transcriptional regulator [Bordetella trematum]AZR93724.1 GntR family transcriptional regulator [Bordetella trematum]NNH17428.1 GntR family transcriptional regulator [Bordetella trematum]SAI59874.1 GntR family transcriptional regulator [Bordetella trematum]SAI71665.1 GntR family transcriptional regulator [Bordetella trematum]SUV98157.1 GntR family transcriptional regulator [Bordetella trematum]